MFIARLDFFKIFMIHLLICFFSIGLLFSKGLQKKEYIISTLKVENNVIQLDGILREKGWQEAEAITELTQREPNYGHPATEKTTISFLYDENNIYVGVVCYYKNIKDLRASNLTHGRIFRLTLFSFCLLIFYFLISFLDNSIKGNYTKR